MEERVREGGGVVREGEGVVREGEGVLREGGVVVTEERTHQQRNRLTTTTLCPLSSV